MDTSETTCCPRFDPSLWDDKMVRWENKRFIKDRVFTVFYMPMNFGKVMKRLDEKVRSAEGTIPDGLCLSDHTSKWNMDVYLAVDTKIPDAANVTVSGELLSKVYEGPYKETGAWCKDFEHLAGDRGLSISKWYMWYTTCPRCAKKYGKNYVVIMGKVS